MNEESDNLKPGLRVEQRRKEHHPNDGQADDAEQPRFGRSQ
jgi:hypothetical protein